MKNLYQERLQNPGIFVDSCFANSENSFRPDGFLYKSAYKDKGDGAGELSHGVKHAVKLIVLTTVKALSRREMNVR